MEKKFWDKLRQWDGNPTILLATEFVVDLLNFWLLTHSLSKRTIRLAKSDIAEKYFIDDDYLDAIELMTFMVGEDC